MADISKVNNVAIADIAKINNVAKADIEAIDGIEVPASGPTASANLVHWWKMNEGSTTSATDYGSGTATGTNLTMSGVTANTGGGPSAIGSPDHIETTGANDDEIYTKTKTGPGAGAGNTVIGDVIDAEDISFAFWMRAPSHEISDVHFFNFSTVEDRNDGGGLFYRQDGGGDNDSFWFYFDGYTLAGKYTYTDIYHNADVGTGWVHWTFTYPASGSVKLYLNGSIAHTFASQTNNAGLNSYPLNTYLSFGCLKRYANGVHHADAHFSDIRLYDKVLSAGEAAAIAAGDW